MEDSYAISLIERVREYGMTELRNSELLDLAEWCETMAAGCRDLRVYRFEKGKENS